MEPPKRHGEISLEKEGSSAHDNVMVETSLAARLLPEVSEYVPIEKMGIEAHATEGIAEGEGHQKAPLADAETEVTQSAGRLRIPESFVPIRDVKGMLETGKFEGQRIIYVNQKEKKDWMYGITHGTGYFCFCEDCDETGKNAKAPADSVNVIDDVHNLEKSMDRIKEMMDNVLSRLNNIDKSVDVLSKEMHRRRQLFQDLSKVRMKFVDDM